MRLLYDPNPDDERTFRFYVAPEKRRRRTYAPTREIQGVATIERGRVVIKRLVIDEHADDVTTATLRDVPLGEIRRQLHRDVQDHPELLSWAASGVIPDDENPFAFTRPTENARREANRHVREIAAEVKRTGSQGRKPLDDRFLERVADALIACEHVNSNAPAKTLTELFRKSGGPHKDVKEDTVRDWIRKARRAGWLAPTGQGRVSVAPGPRMIKRDKRRRNGG